METVEWNRLVRTVGRNSIIDLVDPVVIRSSNGINLE